MCVSIAYTLVNQVFDSSWAFLYSLLCVINTASPSYIERVVEGNRKVVLVCIKTSDKQTEEQILLTFIRKHIKKFSMCTVYSISSQMIWCFLSRCCCCCCWCLWFFCFYLFMLLPNVICILLKVEWLKWKWFISSIRSNRMAFEHDYRWTIRDAINEYASIYIIFIGKSKKRYQTDLK